jgi:hypothetical protein
MSSSPLPSSSHLTSRLLICFAHRSELSVDFPKLPKDPRRDIRIYFLIVKEGSESDGFIGTV